MEHWYWLSWNGKRKCCAGWYALLVGRVRLFLGASVLAELDWEAELLA